MTIKEFKELISGISSTFDDMDLGYIDIPSGFGIKSLKISIDSDCPSLANIVEGDENDHETN